MMQSFFKITESTVTESKLSDLSKSIKNDITEISELDKPIAKEVFINDAQENKIPLTEEQKEAIMKESGYSSEVVDHISSWEEYEVYRDADLKEVEINGRICLVRDIDMDYVDEKTGLTNKELMEQGKSPIDSKTGEKIELHHIGQKSDSPLAELTSSSEHSGNYSTLHENKEESWRRDPDLKNQYNNVERPNHWKERSQE